MCFGVAPDNSLVSVRLVRTPCGPEDQDQEMARDLGSSFRCFSEGRDYRAEPAEPSWTFSTSDGTWLFCRFQRRFLTVTPWLWKNSAPVREDFRTMTSKERSPHVLFD